MPLPPADGHRRPAIAVAATVLIATLVLSALALAVPAPRILSDELRYLLAAASLAEGDGLRLRGDEYGYSPIYPVLLAPILALAPDRETAYPLLEVANALLFALTAIPVYLLARRLLPPWWSIGVAALSISIPSSVYVSLVLTENAAYPASALAILALVLALERPSPSRQLAALTAIGVAFLVRAQFGSLLPTFLAALVLQALILPRAEGRRWTLLWPTVSALALGGCVGLAVALATGRSPIEWVAAYDDLWSSYHPLAVGKWLVYHLTALELLVAIVPFAVAPIVLWRLLAAARRGAVREAAFACAFITLSSTLLLVAAAFSSTDAGLDRLHDRYLFYVAPLWLIAFAVWLHDGLPRPFLAAALGVGLTLVLPAITPYARLTSDDGGETDAAVAHLAQAIRDAAITASSEELSGKRVLLAVVVALVAAVALLPRRFAPAFLAPVAALLLLSSALAWRSAHGAAGDMDRILGDRSWVDNVVENDGSVVSLYVPTTCPGLDRTEEALLLTEFFNRSVRRGYHAIAPDGSLLPSPPVRVAPDGTLITESDEAMSVDYLLTAPGLELDGQPVTTATTVSLTLWKVGGEVRFREAGRAEDLPRLACASGRS
ncbi:hypothetical protein BH18ACT13_BH18ACT13_06480 [soil metagenome]